MKHHLLIIGPIPPPIHGESLALQHLIESKEILANYKINLIDTNREAVNHGGKLSLWKIIQDIRNIISVWKIARNKHIDILYISISQTKLGLIRDSIIIWLSSKHIRHIIAHLHGNNLGNVLDSLNPISLSYISRIMKNIETGIVLSEKLANNFKQLPKRIDVIPNGIEKDYFSDNEVDLAIKKRESRKNFTILYLSNLIEEKGYIELIRAVQKLLRDHAKVELLLAGQVYNPKEFHKIMSEVTECQMGMNIHYLGLVIGEKKRNILLNSNVMALPTKYKIEGQPISIIEGMAAGLPIISTNQGAIPELIKDNGIILRNNSVSSLVNAINSLRTNKELYQRYEKSSRIRFLNRYTMNHYIGGLISTLNRSIMHE